MGYCNACHDFYTEVRHVHTSDLATEIEAQIEAMKQTAAYRQYVESEIDLIMNGQGLPLRRPIGLIDPDTMRFRE